MADMLNQNLNNNALQNKTNNLRPAKPFGLNVRVPERTIQQITESVKANASSGVSGIFKYLEKNEHVFDGTVARQLDDLFVQDFNTKQILKNADKNTESTASFVMDM
ncbi:hypothetical protein IKE67_03800 [bacterium]|nr:hypothetical protein [bacterium]